MKKPIYFLFIGLILFSTSGCAAYFGVKQSKKQMDLAEQINRPADVVWEASLGAAEELAIAVDGKEFDGKKGFISGHTGELNFIRIHVEQLEPELTLVGIQARTSAVPWTNKGFKREFAQSIMEQIKKNLD